MVALHTTDPAISLRERGGEKGEGEDEGGKESLHVATTMYTLYMQLNSINDIHVYHTVCKYTYIV